MGILAPVRKPGAFADRGLDDRERLHGERSAEPSLAHAVATADRIWEWLSIP